MRLKAEQVLLLLIQQQRELYLVRFQVQRLLWVYLFQQERVKALAIAKTEQ
jgi:hypothetical protein